ncbi:uncharacterized protein LOC119835398 [Zerene cesonia]|uniref:uncharacterized protein LOC119835398 n=1 Tax=Zerene cesonia TaxID=33412 RepID=UPI0018E4EF7C|nr:uncharacterized protein LOC119835398 [Zerene cesonia]
MQTMKLNALCAKLGWQASITFRWSSVNLFVKLLMSGPTCPPTESITSKTFRVVDDTTFLCQFINPGRTTKSITLTAVLRGPAEASRLTEKMREDIQSTEKLSRYHFGKETTLLIYRTSIKIFR